MESDAPTEVEGGSRGGSSLQRNPGSRGGSSSRRARRRGRVSRDAEKERGLFLMPDAPPKRSHKSSPERVECPLVEGVPREPPPRIPQPWELVKMESDAPTELEGGSRGGSSLQRSPGSRGGPGSRRARGRGRVSRAAEKESGLFLMPDAPPKRSRKASPERVECPLMEGVPREPPPRIPQPWELIKMESDAPTEVVGGSRGGSSPQRNPGSRGCPGSRGGPGSRRARRRGRVSRDAEKERGLFLKPDAPPKRSRKASPERLECPLMEGVSREPPPRIPQPWELIKMESDAPAEGEGGSRGGSSLQRGPGSRRARGRGRGSRGAEKECGLVPPEKVECSLIEGVPHEPPSRIPQPWELVKMESDAPAEVEGGSRGGSSLQRSPGSRKARGRGRGSRGAGKECGLVPPQKVECPLIEGVPREPPSRIPQPWELVNSTERPVPPPSPTPTLPLPSPPPHIPLFSSSTDILSASYEDARSLSLMPVDTEFISFSPESSVFSSPQPQSPSLFTPAHPGSSSLVEDDVDSWMQRPTEGSDVDEDDINPQDRVMFSADVDTELVLELDAAEDEALRELSRAQDADADVTIFDWTQDVSTFTGSKEHFEGPSGPTFPVNGETPLSILQRIWDVELMSMLVVETNKYAQAAMQKDHNPKSRISKWEDTTVDEMWVFFAILIVQSLAPLPVESEYWYPKLDLIQVPIVAKVMPYARFILIKKCLHFVDDEQIVGTSNEDKKIAKIKPLIDMLRGKFSSMYMPAQEIALDESLLLWKGRLSFAQLIATKKRVGIKSYELCESKTGYLWDKRIYTGMSTTHREPESESSNEPQTPTSKIVFDLVRPLLGRGHVLVMDNFYNAPLLSRLLKKQKTDTMGTLRLNREFIPDSLKVTESEMRPGEVAFSQTTDMTIVVWRDANLVPMISTYHKVEVGGKEKFGRFFYKPQVVLDYNLYMGGVDKKDQLLSAFPMVRTSNQVWYKKLFRRMYNVSIMNAWIIFCTHNTTMSARRYRQNLVEEILAKHKVGWAPNGSVKVVAKIPVKRLLEGGHYLERSESRNHRCKWCSMHGRASRTSYHCDVCKTALCIDPCFKAYHTQKE